MFKFESKFLFELNFSNHFIIDDDIDDIDLINDLPSDSNDHFSEPVFQHEEINDINVNGLSRFKAHVLYYFNTLLGIDPEIAYLKHDESDGLHFTAFVKYNENTYRGIKSYRFVYDHNSTTDEYIIGNGCSFPTIKWAGLSYPIIKIIENHHTPIYYAEISTDEPFRREASATEIISNFIDYPFAFKKISDSLTFYRTTWNGQSYYLPDWNNNATGITVPANVKLSHKFINNFLDILNFANSRTINNTYIFYDMFESFDDFKKMVTLLVEKDFLVADDYHNVYDKDNYKSLLVKMQSDVVSHENKINSDNAEKIKIEQESKIKVEKLTSPAFLELFNKVKIQNIAGRQFPLNVRQLAALRILKNVYMKLHYALIELFLKDNGIDIEKLTTDSENRAKQYATQIYENFKKYSAEDFQKIIDRMYLSYKQDFSDASDLKRFQSYLNHMLQFSELSYNDNSFDLYKKIQTELWPFIMNSGDFNTLWWKGELTEDTAVYKILDGNYYENHDSNKEIMIRRFIALVNKYTVLDYADRLLNDIKVKHDEEEIDDVKRSAKITIEMIGNSDFIHTDFGNKPFDFKEVYFKLSNYTNLYKFFYFMAKAAINAYDNANVLYMHDKSKCDIRFDETKELTDKEPNMGSFKFGELIKCMETIFKSIDKKLNK